MDTTQNEEMKQNKIPLVETGHFDHKNLILTTIWFNEAAKERTK